MYGTEQEGNRGSGFRGLLEATISNDYIEFLGKVEAKCETALVRESRP
jgi:hypothetical protein